MDIAFVILHYITDMDTYQCIESIEHKIGTGSYHIIVVDNASNNGSGQRIQEKYLSNERVTVIINENNFGFSKGLNVGIRYAREKYDPKYIVACNNDIVLLSDDLCDVLNEKFERTSFAVAGPMMITKDGKCNVNPIRNTIRSKKEAQYLIKKNNILIMLCNLHMLKLYELQMKIRKTRKKIVDPEVYLKDQVDFQLHGAFWIFSVAYFNRFDGLDDGTFLYGEESLLYLHLMRNNLHTLYTPDIRIFHKEDSSTESLYASSAKKIKFSNPIGNDSMRYYIKVFEKYEKSEAKID